MSMEDSSSLHPLAMETGAAEGSMGLDSCVKQGDTADGDARGKPKMLGIDVESERVKLLSPIPSYETDRYRLASPHSSKI